MTYVLLSRTMPTPGILNDINNLRVAPNRTHFHAHNSLISLTFLIVGIPFAAQPHVTRVKNRANIEFLLTNQALTGGRGLPHTKIHGVVGGFPRKR